MKNISQKPNTLISISRFKNIKRYFRNEFPYKLKQSMIHKAGVLNFKYQTYANITKRNKIGRE